MTLVVGQFSIDWLDGGLMHLDGGAMFGVVPKPLWSAKYPVDDNNRVPLEASPILVRAANTRCILDTGLGARLTEKQMRNFHITRPYAVVESLRAHGITTDDIEHVCYTHLDFDHASGGVTASEEDNNLKPRYPSAVHWINRREWEDFQHPNERSKHTYWPDNGRPLEKAGIVHCTDEHERVVPGIELIHTGGHTRGHQIVLIHSGSDRALYLGDLLPTHAHLNPLWVPAYDNFPLESIMQKQRWLDYARRHSAWLLFYHDAEYAAIRLDEDGNIKETIRRDELRS